MFDTLFQSSGLSLDRLRTFLMVAEAGSIAKAAPDDPSRQSQFSRQIRELEEHFGVELTRRLGKGLCLTPAGLRLAALIRGQFQDLEDFRREQQQAHKVFMLGAASSLLDWLVTPVASAIASALGDASLILDSQRSRQLVESVREGRLDLAVVRSDAIPDPLPRTVLCQLSFHLCVPRRLLPKDATAASLRDSATWKRLPFATGRDGGQLDAQIREIMQSHGVDFSPRYECSSLLLVKQLIESGQCAGILPSVGLHGLDPKQTLMAEFEPLRELRRHLALHWNQRQMQRRNVPTAVIQKIAHLLTKRWR